MLKHAFIAAALLAGLFAAVHSPADAAPLPHVACPTEDSRLCVWDAQTMGNGEGHSFWVDAHNGVHYVSHARAQRMLGL